MVVTNGCATSLVFAAAVKNLRNVAAAWSGLINAWEGGMPDVKAHEVS